MVALIAVAVVSLSLALYAGVLEETLPGASERRVTETAVRAVEDDLAPVGVARPDRLDRASAAGPDGYHLNATLRVEERRWTTGPVPPESADTATRSVGVRVAPARVVAGDLAVVVWR